MNRNSVAALCTATVIALGVGASSNCQAGVFGPGEFITYSQDGWGTLNTPASQLLFNHFFQVYPNGIEIGIIGVGGNSAIFNTPEAVLDYLPTIGDPGPLDNDLTDPMSTSSGVFGGYVLALQIDVDFSDAGHLAGTSPVLFGDLILHDLTATPLFNGFSVRQFLTEANQFLGGTPPPYSYDDIAALTNDVTLAFEDGTPSQFAQDHLMVIPAPGSIAALAMLVVPGLGRPHRRRTA